MFLKCTTAIVIAALTGALLLGLRQQRFETMHDMAKVHASMNKTRQHLWNLQTRVAAGIEPSRLQSAITQANLPFEPFTPSTPVPVQVVNNQKNLGLNLLKSGPSDIDLADGPVSAHSGAQNASNPSTPAGAATPAKPGSASRPAATTTPKSNSTGSNKPAPASSAATRKPGVAVANPPRRDNNAAPVKLVVNRPKNRN